MNCNEDLIPLYADAPFAGSTNGTTSGSAAVSGRGGTESNGAEGSSGLSNSQYGGTKSNGSLHPPSYSLHGSRAGQGPSGNGNATPQSAGLQTPTPFYTPNEPSPRFMNSPVFSYSTPDTTLYQGPYSPIRTSSLYPPGSPYLNSSLNTPTFVITNLSPATSSASSAATIGMGASSSGSNSSSTSSSSATPSIPTLILGPSSGFNSPLFPITVLSPASSQTSSTHNYDDPHDSKATNGYSFLLPNSPIWNIFMSGTKVRFINDVGLASTWYLVDHIAQLSDLSPLFSHGISLKGEYAPHGLSVKQYVVTSSAKERVQITFSPIGNDQLHHPNIEADCEASHPFMVMKKGVCAVKPEGFTGVYGSHCMKLEMLDICLNLSSGGITKQHHQHQYLQLQPTSVFMANGISTSSVPCNLRNGHGGTVTTTASSMSRSLIPSHFSSHQPMEDIKSSFSDLKHNYLMDTKGHYMEDIKPFAHPLPVPISVIPTSHHSQQSHHLDHHHIKQENFPALMETESSLPLLNGSKKSPPSSSLKTKTKSKKSKESNNNAVSSSSGATVPGEPKGRRPMNAFLVYAKEMRPLLIQMYPGKDNRSISTLLGDSWKTLAPEEKSAYIKTAKDSADEQKKLHPDCWKRKRSQQQQSNPPPMKMELLTKVS